MSAIFAWFLLVSPADAADAVLYVVRHAEKATAPAADPPLTPAGQARAEALAKLLKDVPLAAVHSTDTTRTRTTAAPTSTAGKLTPALYDAIPPLVAAIRATGGAHLVVGHSNTIADIVSAAGGDPGPAVADTEFDRLYVVVLPDAGKPTTIRLHYGP